jgi:hypothetical protein
MKIYLFDIDGMLTSARQPMLKCCEQVLEYILKSVGVTDD